MDQSTVVIRHNRKTGRSDVEVFTGRNARERGYARRVELELADAAEPAIEIVSINGRLEDVRLTHARYFKNGVKLHVEGLKRLPYWARHKSAPLG